MDICAQVPKGYPWLPTPCSTQFDWSPGGQPFLPGICGHWWPGHLDHCITEALDLGAGFCVACSKQEYVCQLGRVDTRPSAAHQTVLAFECWECGAYKGHRSWLHF